MSNGDSPVNQYVQFATLGSVMMLTGSVFAQVGLVEVVRPCLAAGLLVFLTMLFTFADHLAHSFKKNIPFIEDAILWTFIVGMIIFFLAVIKALITM